MDQLNRILAASDLSAPARHAAERAALVAKDTATSLELLHVANLAALERLRRLIGAGPIDMAQRVLDDARLNLAALAADLQHRHGVTVGSHVVAGRLLEELVRKADELAAGLLVCGARGESVLRHFTLGTTALRVLGTTKCPVLVVKQRPHETYRRLLVPVDLSSSSRRVIEHARIIAPQADIVLLNVFDVPFEAQLRHASVDDETINQYRIRARQEATQQLRAIRDEVGLDAYGCSLVVLHGDPTTRIIQQEQERDCDLIVMGKHGESWLETMLLGSVTKHVLAESQGDVLVSV